MPARLRGKAVAMFEQKAVVVREGQLDDRQNQHHQDRREHHHHDVVEAFGHPLRERRGQLAQPVAAAGDGERQQHNAGGRCPEEVSAPAQAMIASGFVFVQSSQSQ